MSNGGRYKISSYSSTLPRVVDAKIKSSRCMNHEIGPEKSRISGDLYIVESCNLHLRYAEVRDGNLLLYRYNGRLKEFHIRIPLYNLSINLDFSRQNGQFSLTRYSDLTPLATFQVVDQKQYAQWLKALAVEIIRQTPLNILKFLDILFIDDILQKSAHHSTRSPCTNGDLNGSDSYNKFESSKANACDSDLNKMVRSVDSFDSGFHSLPPLSSRSHSPHFCYPKDTQPVFFEEILQKFETTAKPKSKISRSDSIKASVSSSCLNLINRIKKLNHCKENEPSPLKTKFPKNDKTKEPKSKWCETANFQADKTEPDFVDRLHEPRKLVGRPRSYGDPGDLQDLYPDEKYTERSNGMQSNKRPSVTFEIPEELLQNEELHVLIRLLTKCQIDKQYVPVREKRLLFESLNRFSFSVDNLKRRRSKDGNNLERSLSLNTLCENQTPVKSIRDYFESLKNETPDRVIR